jgi:hypothetical protein
MGAGKIAYTQVVKTDRHQILDDGTPQKKASNDKYSLDDANGEQYGGTTNISDGGSMNAWSQHDSPGEPVDKADPSIKQMRINDDFKLYLMYQSGKDGSIWVTLQKLTWQCNEAAASKNASGTWSMSSTTIPTATAGQPSTERPHWSGLVSPLMDPTAWIAE